MSFKFLNDGQDGVQRISPIDTFIDPVSKIRVSNPSNLIDTDFEYGLQPTKWETVELINNTPAFFSKGGDTTIPDITAITTNAGTREITVTTAFPHNLDVGIPIRVSGTKSVTADGSYIINATPTNVSFTYLARGDQDETVSIFDLYTSIITGEFFQGSQISIDAAEGITTDGASPSILTVKTENKHGFGPNTPFYFLNLNSTIAQEFEAQNTASVSFDPTNSSTAQTFDGSNTLLQTPIDLSNSATTSTLDNVIASIDAVNSTITVNVNSGDSTSWANLKEGDPLYHAVTAGGGYFQNNPRGVVFIKSVENLITNQQATFQVSQLPNGDAIPTLSGTTGNFRIANQARTFAGNNQDPETQVDITITRGNASTFDASNEETVVAGLQIFDGTSIDILVPQGSINWYVGAMVLFSTDGTPPSLLSNNSTYFVTSFAARQFAGEYEISLAEFPGGTPIDFTESTSGSGTRTFRQIGISVDKDIVHVKDANFAQGDMLEYVAPEDGAFVYNSDDIKKFFFVQTAYDAHNYVLNDVLGATFNFITATGGDNVFEIWDGGRAYRVHEFTTVGESTFEVESIGETDGSVEYLVVAGGGGGGGDGSAGGGAGGYRSSVTGESSGGGAAAESPLSVSVGSYSVTVGDGGSGKSGDFVGDNGDDSVFDSITSTGGGGSPGWAYGTAQNGGSGSGGANNPSSVTAPGSGTQNQGFDGGDAGPSGTNAHAGGGGAGGVGGNRSGSNGGAGGSGVSSSITGFPVFRGGGGAGGGVSGGGGAATAGGGSGGGLFGGAGSANTGGGGGGTSNGGTGGNGGSGIVVVRYPITPINEEIIAASGGETSLIVLEDN